MIAYELDDVQIIVKTLADPHRKAVVLFNRGLRDLDATLTAAHLKFAAGKPIAIKDLWSKQESAFTGDTTFHLAPRQSVMLIASGERVLPDGVYLSEVPASINIGVDGVARPETDPTIHQMVSPWGGTRSSGERTSYGGWGGAQADAAPYGTANRSRGAEIRHRHRNSGGLVAGGSQQPQLHDIRGLGRTRRLTEIRAQSSVRRLCGRKAGCGNSGDEAWRCGHEYSSQCRGRQDR